MAISVLLVADDDRVRLGLRRPLERSGEVNVVATAAIDDDICCLVRDLEPDVILLDVLHGDGRALRVCEQVAGRAPVLVLSSHLTTQEWRDAAAAGAADFHLKTIGVSALVRKIEAVRSSARTWPAG